MLILAECMEAAVQHFAGRFSPSATQTTHREDEAGSQGSRMAIVEGKSACTTTLLISMQHPKQYW